MCFKVNFAKLLIFFLYFQLLSLFVMVHDCFSPVAVFSLPLKSHLHILDMRYAWKLRDFCDVTIVVSGVHFHLHKAIICSRSSFFRALCGTGLKESQSSCVHLNEDDPRVLEAIFEYLYTDELELTEENHELVIPILIAANQYSVVGCKEFMEDVVGCNLDVENVLSLALLAEQHEVGLVQRLGLSVLGKEIGKILLGFYFSPRKFHGSLCAS